MYEIRYIVSCYRTQKSVGLINFAAAVDLSDWELVRHTPPSHWHPATDHLKGTEVYG